MTGSSALPSTWTPSGSTRSSPATTGSAAPSERLPRVHLHPATRCGIARRRGICSKSNQLGGMNSGSPSRIRTIHSVEWICRWCRRQSMTRFDSFVSPPYSHSRIWCTSHQETGRPHPGWAHPWSRAATARRSPSGMVRVARPTSNGWPLPFITIGTTAASQHSTRSDSGATGPPKSKQAARARFLSLIHI